MKVSFYTMLKFFSSALIVYGLICIILYVGQRFFMYFPSQDMPQPQDLKVIKLNTADGLTLTAWYKPAEDGKPTFIYFHGNGGNIAMREPAAELFTRRGFGILLVEYRGYGGNPGTPTELGLYQDADAAYAFLRERGVPADCIILFGESLGCAIAVDLASRKPVAALILRAPFTSMPEVGRKHYPLLPLSLFVKDRYASIKKIGKLNIPIVIAHGTSDKIVPYKLGQKLFAQANQPKEFLSYAGFDHNNLDSDLIAEQSLIFLRSVNLLNENNECQ